jgi:hypothetical protein
MADLNIPSYQRNTNRIIPATRLNAYAAFGGKSGVAPVLNNTSLNTAKTGYGMQKGSNFVTKPQSGIAGWWADAKKFISHPELPELGKGMMKQIPKGLAIDGIINPTELGRGSDTFAKPAYDGSPAISGKNFDINKDYSLNTIDLSSTLNDATSPKSAFAMNGSYTPTPSQVVPTAPIVNAPIGSPKIKPTTKGSDLPPLPPLLGNKPLAVPTSAVAGVVATQPTDMIAQPAIVQSPMDVAKYNAEQQNLLADKNILAQKEIAGMGQKSDWEKYGSMASGIGSTLGGVAGIYGAVQNAKYQKDQTKMQKAMIRGDEANKSAFAKAAGGTYQRSGV